MDRFDGYLRIRAAAEFLGVAPNTLRTWGREEKIPEYRHPVNNYRLYRRGDLEAILRRVNRTGRPTGKHRQRQPTGS
jgi:DNA (cytosine-5)-methyltransferase 1